MKPRVGVVGVGAMGMGVARALLERGFAVAVRDIIPEREAEAVARGASRDFGAVDVTITLVVDAAQTRAVLETETSDGPGFSWRKTPGPFLVMMCSTIAPSDTEAIAANLASRGIDLLDAPISGGPARARAGTLSMMASGSDAAFARCAPVIEAMGSKCFRMGARAGWEARSRAQFERSVAESEERH